ncbi:DUF2752 domain-containing protein [Nesterenkonia flava]|uniref:DUF2752 domain-containing protein n=1 Tax=Nesterenkonia flava TaxID=469799 RepID=UPI00337D6065
MGIGGLYLFSRSDMLSLIPPCGIYESYGVLCPGCGGSRAVQALSSGNVFAAVQSNIWVVLLVLGAIWLLCSPAFRIWAGPTARLRLDAVDLRVLLVLILTPVPLTFVRNAHLLSSL